MKKIESEKPRVGISACLLGERVRHDGGHKRHTWLVDVLGPRVEWVPVCPEMEIGLGVPRDTIRLVADGAQPRLVVERTGEDLTVRMRRFAARRVRALAARGLDGYVLKSRSPSCGLFGVPVHAARGSIPGRNRRGRPSDVQRRRTGRGAFADVLVIRLPDLSVEEEGRLADPKIRAAFLARVFATHSARRMSQSARSASTRRGTRRRR
ncbi:MAG: DUF523 domain-containing protein [Candidatus Rokubacteria bacterium]|nr:DUF523 domain-containing protein [Candidatus Rokubacteria bacterium]